MGFGWTETLLSWIRMTSSSTYLTAVEKVTEIRMLMRLEKKGEKVYKSYLIGISSKKSPFGRKSQF